MKPKLPKSIRKYIRKEKSRIRREILNTEDQNEKILELVNRFGVFNKDKLTNKIEKNKINIERKTSNIQK